MTAISDRAATVGLPIAFWKGVTLVHDGGFLAVANLATIGSPTVVNGDAFTEVATAGGRGGDAIQTNGTSQALVIPADVMQIMLAAEKGTLILMSRRNDTIPNLAIKNGGYELHGFTTNAGNSANAFYLSSVMNASFGAPQTFWSFTMVNAAVTAVASAIQHGGMGTNGDWGAIGFVFDVAAGYMRVIGNGILGPIVAITAANLPDISAGNRFLIGGYNTNAAGTTQAFAVPSTNDYLFLYADALTQEEISFVVKGTHGRLDEKIYGSLDETGLERAQRFLAAAHGGADVIDFGDSRQRRSATQQVAAGSITSISTGAAPVFTSINHRLAVGNTIVLKDTNSTPSCNGLFAVATTPTADTYTLTSPPTVTVAGTAGTFGAVYTSSNARRSQFNCDAGNELATAIMLTQAMGRPLSSITVGCRNVSSLVDAYYLGIYNSLVPAPVTPTDAHVLAKDLTNWNRTSSAAYAGGSASGGSGWMQDIGTLETGTQADGATTGLIIDPTNPNYKLSPFADLEVVVPYATYASGGGTIYPEVVRVSDGSVVVAAQAVACTGSNGWSSVTVHIGRISEPVRLRLQGTTAASAKFSIGPCTIRDRNMVGGFHYACQWAFGGQDVQMVLRSLVQDAATFDRLVALLTIRRATTGSTVLVVIDRWGQNARNLQSVATLDNNYIDNLTQGTMPSNTRPGHKANRSAFEYQMGLAATAAGYTSVWHVAAAYPQITNVPGGDDQMENNLQRAAMERADEDVNERSLVIDAVECGLTAAKLALVAGADVDGVSHLSEAGHQWDGYTEGALLASSATAPNGGAGVGGGGSNRFGIGL